MSCFARAGGIATRLAPRPVEPDELFLPMAEWPQATSIEQEWKT
jgi:hypothetical protein